MDEFAHQCLQQNLLDLKSERITDKEFFISLLNIFTTALHKKYDHVVGVTREIEEAEQKMYLAIEAGEYQEEDYSSDEE